MTLRDLSKFLFGLVLLLPAQSWADGLTVSPVVVDTEIKKSGDTLSFDIKNETNDKYSIEISFKAFGHDQDGTPQEVSDSYKYSAAKLLSTKTPKFTLDKGESKKIEVRVDIPAGRTGGAYSFMYVLGKPASGATNTVAVWARFGVAIELTLPGAHKESFTVGKIDATQKTPGGDVTFMVPINSTGDTHVKVGGSLSVTDAQGKEVGKVTVYPDNVFPLMVRYVKGTWKAPKDMNGKYKLAATLSAQSGAPVTATGTVEFIKPGELAQVSADVRKFVTPGQAMAPKPVQLEATVQNNGNVPLTSGAKVTWHNQTTNEVVATATMAPTAAIPPKGKGTYKGVLSGGLPVGAYLVQLEVLDGNDRTVGKYASNQQIIAKEVTMAAKVNKVSGPTAKSPGITAEFENQSNVEVDAGGHIDVIDDKGNTTPIGLDKKHAKVGEKIIFNVPVPDDIEAGNYSLKATIEYGLGANGQPISVEGLAAKQYLTPPKSR